MVTQDDQTIDEEERQDDFVRKGHTRLNPKIKEGFLVVAFCLYFFC